MPSKGVSRPKSVRTGAASRSAIKQASSMPVEVLEEGRFVESSTSWLNGRARHERTAIAGEGGSTVLTDRLVIESRGMVVDALIRASVTHTFRRRHRRLRRHFQKGYRAPE